MKLLNSVGVVSSTTGTGTITLGAVLSTNMFTFAEAGAVDADEVYYRIDEGGNVEIGIGTLGGSVTTLSRDTVLVSKIGGTAGTTKLTLAGAAQVRAVTAAEALDALLDVASLTAADPLDGEELVHIVQSGNSRKVAVSNLRHQLLDEDDMASDSATQPPTQQSVKAYVDAMVRIRRIFSFEDTNIYTTSSGTVYGTSGSLPGTITRESTTSKLLVISMAEVRAVQSSGTAARWQGALHYFDGSAFQLAPHAVGPLLGFAAGGAASATGYDMVSNACILTQAHLRSDSPEVWLPRWRFNVSAGSSVEMRSASFLCVEYEDAA